MKIKHSNRDGFSVFVVALHKEKEEWRKISALHKCEKQSNSPARHMTLKLFTLLLSTSTV